MFFVSSCGGVSIGCNLVFIAEQMGGEPVEGYAANFRVVHARDVPDILASQGGEDATVEESVTYGKHSLVVVVFEEVAEKLGGTDVECPNTFGVGREVSLESLGLGERDAVALPQSRSRNKGQGMRGNWNASLRMAAVSSVR